MDPRLILPLPPESPWAAWARPDIHHCEANLAGWIAAPADTWSNVAYMAVGLWLMRSSVPKKTLGIIAVIVGATSFAFHASYTAFGQALDYFGMYVLASWLIARGVLRAGWSKDEKITCAVVVGASCATYVMFARLHWPVQTTMILLVALMVSLEIYLMRGAPQKSLLAALALFAAAYACWHMDHSDRFCRPDDHLFQWHAAWHVLTALAFLPLARFHAVLE